MASNTKTFVESYHINVGLGDSAIHVLATEGNGSQNPNLVAAVLVDGGLARDAAAQNISATIEDIEKRYNIKLLKFRSVVVTHWDADHWKGINKLLESEYPKRFDKGGLYNRFFHDTAVKTTVYAPSRWTGSKAQDDTGKPNKKMKSAEHGITIKEDGKGFCFSFRDVSQAKAIVGSSVIGYDFFTNTKPSKNQKYSELKTFKDLIGPNAPIVGMYCVASDLEVIGLKKRPNRRNMNLESSLFNQLPTKTNQQSIAAIILWDNMHVSHFFAGDLDFWGENLLAEWLEENLKSNKDGPNINCLKSSHHGARNSNPPKLFMVTKPKYIIFSVADHYGHPAWEVLLVLFLLYAYQIKTSQSPCIATCYPYWLKDIHGLEGLGENKINVDAFLPPEELKKLSAERRKHANRFINMVETLFKSVPSDDNIYNMIFQSCVRDNASDNESIFEQIALNIGERLGNLFQDLWQWDLDGAITSEVVYLVLKSTNNINDDEGRYRTKNKPSDKKDRIDQVVFDEVIDGFGEKEPPINTKKSNKETKMFQMCHVFLQEYDEFRTVKNSMKQKKIESHVEQTSPLGKRSLESSKSHDKKPKPKNSKKDGLHQLFMQSFQVPLLGAPVAIQANNSSQSTQYSYSILSSSYASSAATRAEFLDYTVLEVDDWLDDFLLSMKPSIMRLSSSLDEEWVLLHEDDYLGKWIRTGLGGSQMAVKGDGPEFRIIMPNGLIFNTGEAAKALGTDAKMSSDGLSPWTRSGTMVFGLDRLKSVPKASSWSISDILSLFSTDTSSKMNPLELISPIVVDNLLGMRWTLDLATSEGRRNAIWVTPITSYRTILRLAFIPVKDSSQSPLRNFLDQFFPPADEEDDAVLDISDIQLIFRKVCLKKEKKGQRTTLASMQFLTLSAVITLFGPKPEDPAKPRAKVTPNISIELASTGALELTIRTTQSDDSFTAVVSGWLSRLFPGCDTKFDTLSEQNISKNIWFRRLTIALNPDKSISRASVALEVNAKLGQGSKPDQNLPIIFEAEYTNTPGGQSDWSISGNLWLRTNTNAPLTLFSNYEEYRSLLPLTPNPVQVLELTTLFASMSDAGNIPDLPKGIPNAITAAGFRINKESIFVSGTISDCRHVVEGGNAPPLRLQELSVEARWNWKQKQVQVDLYFWLSLKLPSWYDAPEGCAANSLTGSVSYKSGGKWNVSAEVRDLNLGMLYDFFPEDVKDTLFQLLKGIRIVDLGVYYYSQGAGQGTGLLCEGKLMLGDIMSLQLSYERDPNGGWRFHANLGPDDEIIEPITLGQIMSSFVDSSDASLCSSLPDFLADTVIIGGTDSNPKLEFTVENDKVVGPKMTVTASIMGFTVEFVQINCSSQNNGSEDSGEKSTSGEKPGKILRLFKAVLTEIPMPKSIPILDHMDQPFDELGFFWINQTVTRDELVELDKTLDMPDPPPTKEPETASTTGRAQTSTPGMTGGFHFVIISKQKVVLDYPIGKQKKVEDTDDSSSEDGQVKVPGGDKKPSEPSKQDDGDDKGSQSSKTSYKNTVGPLSISQIGFRYESGTLAILMDATIAFGPVALDLIGFTLGLHFKEADGSTKNLKSLSWNDVEVSISGVGVKFERPPLTISGAFLHEKTVDSDIYAGGLTVGFTPWLFQAAGFYGVVGNVDKAEAFKCLFAYAMLRGPIMNIAGFAEISGLTGGFGYNIDLTLPTLDNIVSFPMLTPLAESAPPKELARTLIPGGDKPGPFFNPLNGAMFIAAGLTVTAFQMLEMTAIVAVQWSPRVQLALLGLAKCDVPSIKSPVKFAHIELGIIATIDLDAGIMKVEAQLSPNSWIIHKNCHLTGGFAMYYWFGPGQTDWVMTIGGYHSAFVVPAHYPRPDRLRISWSIDSSLSVTGEAYFAVTPKVCMGGLHIRAALSLGALYAWFDAATDFLMTYSPFHFITDVNVSVGVRFSMDIWFVTVQIAVEIGARLSLMGPPLRGIVHVDFWVFGFDIAFGNTDGANQSPDISFQDFWKLVTQAESSSSESAEAGGKAAHLFSCNKGLLVRETGQDNKPDDKGLLAEKDKDVKVSDTWLVRSGVFQFTIECQFAVQSVTVNNKKALEPQSVTIDDIYAKPMRLSQKIDSTLSVTIEGPDNSSSVWKATSAWKDVPQALWGQYKESEDPNVSQSGGNLSNLLNTGGSMCRLFMGVIIEAPIPPVSLDNMPEYCVDEAMKNDIFKIGSEPKFPENVDESVAFAPLPRTLGAEDWTAFGEAWRASPNPRLAVEMWEDIFKTTGLVKTKPNNLIENNAVLYLSAPLLGKTWPGEGLQKGNETALLLKE